MKRGCIIILVWLTWAGSASGQDAMLSQYWTMPTLVNPAQTGLTESDYRAATAYRNQWASIASPFTTAQATFDARLPQNRGHALGVGGFVRNDQMEAGAFNTFEVSAQSAYHLKAGRNDFVSFGLSAGYRQRSIDFSGLAWDSQFNGTAFDPSIDPGEEFTGMSNWSVDAAFGFNYQRRAKSKFDIGFAAWHYFQNQSFLFGRNDRAIMRQNLIFAWYENYNGIDVIYDFMAARQGGGAMMLMAGGRAYYGLGDNSRYTDAKTQNRIYGGLHYRWADALIASFGFEIQRMLSIGASYDVTTSRLSQANAMRGGWEINLTYTGWFRDSRIKLR